MAAPTNYDQTNEWLTQVGGKVQELINLLKAGIDVGQSGELGNLALFDTLSAAPVGDLAALQQALQIASIANRSVVGGSGDLMSRGAFGLGVDVAQPNWPLPSLADDPSNIPAGCYRAISTTLGRPRGVSGTVVVSRYNAETTNVFYQEVTPSDPLAFTNTFISGAWTGWKPATSPAMISNANGFAFRLGNNLQICVSNELTLTQSTSIRLLTTWPFPAAFSGRTITIPMPHWGSQNAAVNTASAKGDDSVASGATSANLALWATGGNTFGSDASANRFYAIAIGPYE